MSWFFSSFVIFEMNFKHKYSVLHFLQNLTAKKMTLWTLTNESVIETKRWSFFFVSRNEKLFLCNWILIGLIYLFSGISTFVGYLMPKFDSFVKVCNHRYIFNVPFHYSLFFNTQLFCTHLNDIKYSYQVKIIFTLLYHFKFPNLNTYNLNTIQVTIPIE